MSCHRLVVRIHRNKKAVYGSSKMYDVRQKIRYEQLSRTQTPVSFLLVEEIGWFYSILHGWLFCDQSAGTG